MDYKIEEKPEMLFTGYKKHFTGTPADRFKQEENFYVTTRANQYILSGLSHDCDTQYNIMANYSDDGYDFFIASKLSKWSTNNLIKELGEEDAKRFGKVIVPPQLYLICETEKSNLPTLVCKNLRKRAVSQWLPSSEYQLANAAEISVSHWHCDETNPSANNSRYIELWLPIEKK